MTIKLQKLPRTGALLHLTTAPYTCQGRIVPSTAAYSLSLVRDAELQEYLKPQLFIGNRITLDGSG